MYEVDEQFVILHVEKLCNLCMFLMTYSECLLNVCKHSSLVYFTAMESTLRLMRTITITSSSNKLGHNTSHSSCVPPLGSCMYIMNIRHEV
jgi:hypothetical protein